MSPPTTDDSAARACCGGNGLTWLALLIALAGLFGTLWLSIGMKLVPCPLCYYQRTFLMAVFGVLAVGLLSTARRYPGIAGLLALPLAAGGLSVAAYHVFYLENVKMMECPPGLFHLGTAPQQSLALLALLFAVLTADVVKRRLESGLASLLGAILVGALLGGGAVYTASPMPLPPAPAPLVGCRMPAP